MGGYEHCNLTSCEGISISHEIFMSKIIFTTTKSFFHENESHATITTKQQLWKVWKLTKERKKETYNFIS